MAACVGCSTLNPVLRGLGFISLRSIASLLKNYTKVYESIQSQLLQLHNTPHVQVGVGFRVIESVFKALGPPLMLLDCWLDWEVSSRDEQGRGKQAFSQRIFFIQGWFSVEVDLLSI